MAAAAPIIVPAFGKAAKAAQASITEALTADLVVLKGQARLGRKRKGIAPQPLEWEFHLNPAALGVAAVGVALTAWLFQVRLSPGSPREVQLGKWYCETMNTWVGKEHEYSASETPPKVYVPPAGNIGDRWETCVWVNTRTEMQSSFRIKERQGFLGNGTGTEIDKLVYYGLGGWWSPWW